LPHWLEGLKARVAFGCVNAQAISGIVVDHSEDRHLAILSRKARRRVDAPHLVGLFGEDRSIVALGLGWLWLPPRRQQAVFAHQPQHAPLGGTHARQAQSCPHLAVALAMEGRAGDGLRDLAGEFLVDVARANRPCLRPVVRLSSGPMIKRRSRNAPSPQNPSSPVRPSCGGRPGAAHRFDLHRRKGFSSSMRRMRSRRSSFSMGSLAMTDFIRRPLGERRYGDAVLVAGGF
jgi:hypothetical protein